VHLVLLGLGAFLGQRLICGSGSRDVHHFWSDLEVALAAVDVEGVAADDVDAVQVGLLRLRVT
jgi:hypothetical protein